MKKLMKYLFGAAVSALILAGAAVLTVSADSDLIIQTTPSVTLITPYQTTVTSTITSVVISDISDHTENTNTTKLSESEKTTNTVITIISDPLITTDITTDLNSEGTGWIKNNEKWYYNDGEKFLTGIQEIDGEPYLFASNGALKTGWQTVKSLRRYYDSETHSAVYGWVEFMDNKYYVTEESGKLTGMKSIGENTYIFSDTGIMQTGFVHFNNFMYYCDKQGKVLYGDKNKTPIKIDNTYYYISPKGYVMLGWQTINGIRIFYDYDTGIPVYGWVEYQGHYYYIDSSIGKYTGDNYIGLYPYRFNESGILATGIQYFESKGKSSYFYENGERAVSEIVSTDNGNYYFNSDGYTESGLKTVNKKTYYFDDNGKMLFGFQKINDKTYYFDKKNNGVMHTGFLSIGKNKYYFDSNGIMQCGFKKIDNKTYYFDDNGKMQFGLKTINENKYYFNSDGSMHTGFIDIDKKRYYFNSNGIMQYGIVNVDNNLYYFDSKGIMQYGLVKLNNKIYYFDLKTGIAIKGWKNINNNYYYFGDKGEAYTGWQNINGKKYYFDSSGVMLANRRKDNYMLGSDGVASEIKYLKAADTLDSIGWDLVKAFQWSTDMLYYTYTADASHGIEYYAKFGFANEKGNCYVMAAVFCEMARTLGYDAQQISGRVPLAAGGYGPHSWVEIKENGNTYVYDPDFAHETGRNGYKISYGMSGTWIYVKEEEMKD